MWLVGGRGQVLPEAACGSSLLGQRGVGPGGSVALGYVPFLLGCVGGHSIHPWGHAGPSTRPAASRPLSGGRPPPHPTPLWPCNQSRGAGSLARAGSHRYQLTAWVPFPFTRGRLTMADSPHRGPGPPPRERPWRAIGPHDLAPWRGGPPLPTGRTNGAFSGCQRPGSGRNRPPCQPGRAAASSPPCEPAPPHLGLGFTP